MSLLQTNWWVKTEIVRKAKGEYNMKYFKNNVKW